MISKILIANRGEIAVRVIKTCQRLNIKTVAVFSDIDKNSMFVNMADEAYALSGIDASETYLNIDKILEIAKLSNSDAIHPGYGFLSENSEFATRVTDEGLKFIGPTPDAILAMGMKSTAKQIMQQAKVPILPGYHDDDNTEAKLISEAKKIGYPLLVKAAAGGGGKGMRIVESEKGIKSAIDAAKRESKKSFANDKLILEKYLQRPRHIEVQILFDTHGNGVYLHERDCSIQRRYQKIIEEAPAFKLDSGLRQQLGEAAIKAGQAIKYVGAGTIEFLLDTTDNKFYFMEMNTRLQVEHPVTELITGLDLVELQIKVANGDEINFEQHDIALNGHAIEARLYAEDIGNNFLPASGKVKYLEYFQDDNIRIDTGITSNDEISIHYDPMLAKIIAYGKNRDEAIQNLTKALQHTYLIGVKNNIEFLLACLQNRNFLSGNVSTNFIEENSEYLNNILSSEISIETKKVLYGDCYSHINSDLPWLAAAIYYNFFKLQQDLSDNLSVNQLADPWNSFHNFKLNSDNSSNIELNCISLSSQKNVTLTTPQYISSHKNLSGISLTINGNLYVCNNITFVENKLNFNLLLSDRNTNKAKNVVDKQQSYHIKIINFDAELYLFVNNRQYIFNTRVEHATANTEHHAKGALSAPMHGTVVAINVNAGQVVTQGDTLLVLEAMKMEHAIIAPKSGTIACINYSQGQQVNEGAELLVME